MTCRSDPEGLSVDDIVRLRLLNDRFIEACRKGSWAMLQPVLSPEFRYLDGVTGEVWDMADYIAYLEANPAPSLTIDQVTISVASSTAVVSARTNHESGPSNRYVDTYQRDGDEWLCVHACVWPLAS